jgi:hypothetical protein
VKIDENFIICNYSSDDLWHFVSHGDTDEFFYKTKKVKQTKVCSEAPSLAVMMSEIGKLKSWKVLIGKLRLRIVDCLPWRFYLLSS